MTKVIWLGEDTEDIPGPSFTTCYGLKFAKDVPVEVTDPDSLRRAKGNLQFQVIEEQEKSHGESQTQDEEQAKDESKEGAKDDYREREKGTGYSPVKKKVRKKKPSEPAGDRVSTPDP